MKHSLVLVLLLVTAGCRSIVPMRDGLSTADQAALRSIAERDASIVLARDWDTLLAGYAIDAVRMPPNEPTIQGRAAIRRWLQQLPPIQNFTFRLIDLQGNGNIAFMRAAYTITLAPPGATTTFSDSGKILIVLRKQPDGAWLRVVDAFNSDLPPAR